MPGAGWQAPRRSITRRGVVVCRLVPRAEDHFGRATAGLAARLPGPLEVFARLAYNYRWSWVPGGPDVFRDIDPHRWGLCGENPVRLLQEAAPEALVEAARSDELLARAHALEATIAADLAREPNIGPLSAERPAAFFCAEYAIHRSLPIYSGGLGALAGDFLKEASDRAIPLVAVGLMYRTGYFRQRIDASGWQHEYWVDTDPDRLPAALLGRLQNSASDRNWDSIEALWRMTTKRW